MERRDFLRNLIGSLVAIPLAPEVVDRLVEAAEALPLTPDWGSEAMKQILADMQAQIDQEFILCVENIIKQSHN